MSDRERELEHTVAVTVTFRQSTLDKITEAARSLELDVPGYIGIAAVNTAREDLAREDRFRMAGAEDPFTCTEFPQVATKAETPR